MKILSAVEGTGIATGLSLSGLSYGPYTLDDYIPEGSPEALRTLLDLDMLEIAAVSYAASRDGLFPFGATFGPPFFNTPLLAAKARCWPGWHCELPEEGLEDEPISRLAVFSGDVAKAVAFLGADSAGSLLQNLSEFSSSLLGESLERLPPRGSDRAVRDLIHAQAVLWQAKGLALQGQLEVDDTEVFNGLEFLRQRR